jgi:hypothetical protein
MDFCNHPVFERALFGVAAMKSSQLLAGCILVLGCAGAAQAKDMGGTNLHCRGVVADNSVSGVLAAIGAMLSGDAGSGPARPAGDGACHANDGDTSACTTLPGGGGGAMPAGRSSGSDDTTTPAAHKQPTPSLGWQSLLPGSIQ